MQIRYRIYTLSARAIIGYASKTEDGFSFRLSENAVRKCILRGSDEQDDNALFFQTMCVLHGDDFTLPENSVISDLSDVVFYVDFNRVFDQASSRKYLDRQKKAEAMFRPEGITLDFGSGAHSYVAFERSGNMSRQAKLSFLLAVENLIREYEAVLSRIRSCRAPIKNKAKQTDIERILYSRGQEDLYDTDTLYALFSEMDSERIADIRRQLTEQKWHLMDKTERLDFLSDHLPEAEEYFGLFSDFRFGGYRILGDLICNIDDENTAEERKKLHRDTDSDVFAEMMNAYEEKSSGVSARDAVSAVCRKLIKEILNPRTAVRYLVAFGKRNLLWVVVPDAVEKEVRHHAE